MYIMLLVSLLTVRVHVDLTVGYTHFPVYGIQMTARVLLLLLGGVREPYILQLQKTVCTQFRDILRQSKGWTIVEIDPAGVDQ